MNAIDSAFINGFGRSKSIFNDMSHDSTLLKARDIESGFFNCLC